MSESFPFRFDPRYRRLLGVLGVKPENSMVTITDDDRLQVSFGRWSLDTPLSNVTCVQRTGGYHWYKAIGARGSFADRGVTFGTNCDEGVCTKLRDPVPALLGRRFLHPGMTVTVEDPDAFVSMLGERLPDLTVQDRR